MGISPIFFICLPRLLYLRLHRCPPFWIPLSPRYKNNWVFPVPSLQNRKHFHSLGESVSQNEKPVSGCLLVSFIWLVFISSLPCRIYSFNALLNLIGAFLSYFSTNSCERFRGFWTRRCTVSIRIWRCCGKHDRSLYFIHFF